MAPNSVSVALGSLTKSFKRTSKDLLKAFSLTSNSDKDDNDNDNNQQTVITTAKNDDDNNSNQATTNACIDDYFLKLWADWTISCSNNKLVIPEPPEDILKTNKYIINNHGWWPKNYISVEWCPEENQIHTIIPPRTKTSSLSQENYAVITHRILALRLKSRNGNSYKGGSAFKFRRSVIKKVAKVNGLDPNLRLPYDIFVNDFEQYVENALMKNPWKDGTTYPNKGDLKDIKIAHINRRDQRQACYVLSNDENQVDNFKFFDDDNDTESSNSLILYENFFSQLAK
ncbi:5013_t:CDS:2 [Entrophospora sp. SA101]|nr:5009_t:CDS:2 [Entrophospora sp. SA101]CAJ0631377.1 5013_t:CDS:2 [Entrophospora sp. SA101]CAJ0833678.1 5726_t:CDS:2 [Entrophospora sp. SA101]CAJ0914607.1 16431_t:CDS:2 [Entrophospora sp. SA101]